MPAMPLFETAYHYDRHGDSAPAIHYYVNGVEVPKDEYYARWLAVQQDLSYNARSRPSGSPHPLEL
jgi:hypothetical protein